MSRLTHKSFIFFLHTLPFIFRGQEVKAVPDPNPLLGFYFMKSK